MSAKTAWENYPELWPTEKHFMAYLRGAFRSIWKNYPAKHVWKKAQMKSPPKDYVGRAKTVGTCAFCLNTFPASKLEVDHIQQTGSFTNAVEAVEWFWRLLDTNDNWQLGCKECHRVKSHQEKNEGMSFEDAKVAKEIIRLMHKDNKEELLYIFQQAGYNEQSTSNAKKRKEALTEILTKEK